MLINKVFEKSALLHKHGTEIDLSDPLPKIDMSKWNALVAALNKALPVALKKIYLEETSGLIFKWSASKEKFGDPCKRGYLHLLSPEEIITTYGEMLKMVQESKNSHEFSTNVGLQALVVDWPNWIPITRFPNGDLFCIDVTKNFSIVFLEHDVMDGGPYIHGTTIARNLEKLLELWDKIAFADVYDWSKYCNEKGIDIENPLFNSIRSLK
ncbi:SMI1/KNR4 family protein [Paenibacillus sp. GCM10027628]|uniref:SMI1/KNR4 family protein n=1 Tax=Paenibacillus sp. GCM10027628 TaxID=3273413 RepID=UPI00362E04C0